MCFLVELFFLVKLLLHEAAPSFILLFIIYDKFYHYTTYYLLCPELEQYKEANSPEPTSKC